MDCDYTEGSMNSTKPGPWDDLLFPLMFVGIPLLTIGSILLILYCLFNCV